MEKKVLGYRETRGKKLPQENPDWVRAKEYCDIEKNVEDKHLEVFLDIHYIKII